MLAMGLMSAGYSSVDFMSNTMIPITLRHFTANKLVIACIIDLNRLFAFIVQPYVAWKGDHLNTRFGRRRPLLMIGLQGTMAFLLLLGMLPILIQGDLRHALVGLAVIFIVNFFMQAFQDVNGGNEGPLYGDTFGPGRLGRAVAIRAIMNQLMVLFMSYFAMKWADLDEIYAYFVSGGFLAVSLLIVIFMIRENAPEKPPPREAYNPLKHLRLLRENKDYLKVAIIGAAGLMYSGCFMLYLSLFATEDLGLSIGEFGMAIGVGPFLVLVIAVPVGLFVDRLGPKPIIITGFILLAISALSMLFLVHGFWSLLVVNVLYTVASQLHWLSILPMIFQYAPEGERGKVFGLIQFVRSLAAFLISFPTGSMAEYTPLGYRAGYAVCTLLALVGLSTAWVSRTVAGLFVLKGI